MRCDEFQQRMDWLLDENKDLHTDPKLAAHASRCDDCAEALSVWSEIDAALAHGAARVDTTPAASTPAGTRRLKVTALVTLATAVALLLLIPAQTPQTKPTPSSGSPVAGNITIDHQDLPAWPDAWWQTVGDRDWMESTMPAVVSVRQGVAPIERSMRRAVAILMNQTGRTELGNDAVIQERALPHSEQTSLSLSDLGAIG